MRLCDTYFNPRSPHGERRRARGTQVAEMAISIHAPRTGSDALTICPVCNAVIFQSTLPARGATRTRPQQSQAGGISIHAPRTGSDDTVPHKATKTSEFQSTLPARGATRDLSATCDRDSISIHAPRTGSDQNNLLFNVVTINFNPRSPHGERLRKVTILSIRIIGFAQKVYHKTVLLRISLAENAVILPEKPRNPVRTSLQKAGGLRFARAIRAARPYSISSPSGA